MALVVSEGARSTRSRAHLPAHRHLQVGSNVPGDGTGLRIHRIDTRSRGSVSRAATQEVATLWVTRAGETAVAVSIVERARTTSVRWVIPSETEFAVGDEVEVEGTAIVIVGVRAQGHTWRRVGDRFRAPDVQRVYGRRRAIPPAGSNAWSRVRVRPSSAASSTSSTSRSRSGPGTKTTRTVP